MRIHLVHEPPAEALELLARQLPPEIKVTFGKEGAAQGDIEVLVVGVPEREHIEGNPGLRFLIIPFAGVPAPTRKLMREFPEIAIHNLHHNAVATAETALALLFSAAKNVVPMDRQLRKGDWSPRYEKGGELLLTGRTAVVLGFGAVGQVIARMCAAMGMSVIGVRRTSPGKSTSTEGGSRGTPDDVAQVCGVDEMAGLLPKADVLFVAVPLTDETEGMIGEDELQLLPDDAILINVARGPVIDEKALFDHLSSGRIRAGIDVWYRYPRGEDPITSTTPSTFPFHELDNVVMSPHRGGHVREIEQIRNQDLVRVLLAVFAGETVPNRVDPALGY